MYRSMLFVAVFGALLWFPGYMAVRLLNIEQARFLLSVATSYLLSLCVLLVSRYVGLPIGGFVTGVVLIGVILGCVEVLKGRRTYRFVHPFLNGSIPKVTIGWPHLMGNRWLIPGAITCVMVVYLIQLGPYVEIPADTWWHLGQIQNIQATLLDGKFPIQQDIFSLVRLNGTYWYYFPATALYLSGQSLLEGLPALAGANTILLIGMVYSFALFVFRNMASSRLALHGAAAASAFFFVTHFGVNVFSFVRYYTFAPVFLNLGLYFATIVLIERVLTGHDYRVSRIFLLVGLMAAMALIHRQELLYTLVMAFSMLLVAAWNSNIDSFRGWWSTGRWVSTDGYSRRLGVVAILGLVAATIVWMWFYTNRGRSDPLYHNRLISVENMLPFVKNLYILDPTYQFYQVVAAWGMLIFLIYLLHRRWFRGNNYLSAAMLIPLTTVFNPFFIDFFLRIYYAELVWRMSFMLPLSFVGGYILTRYLAHLVSGAYLWERAWKLSMLALLLVLLVPIDTRYFQENYSRLETVRAVKVGNDYRQWKDLLEFLNGTSSSGIITDRITGYVINGLTAHNYPGFKFFGNGAVPYNLSSYDSESFKDRANWLLVINRRNGDYSRIGAISRHWSPRELEVSRYYSPQLLKYIEQSPDRFTRIWERDRIVVYRISPAISVKSS